LLSLEIIDSIFSTHAMLFFWIYVSYWHIKQNNTKLSEKDVLYNFYTYNFFLTHLIPKKPADRLKKDLLDAQDLAENSAKRILTVVQSPSKEETVIS